MEVKNLKIIQWAISRKSKNFINYSLQAPQRLHVKLLAPPLGFIFKKNKKRATVDDIVRSIEKFIVKIAHTS
jgi:hypothetical protein